MKALLMNSFRNRLVYSTLPIPDVSSLGLGDVLIKNKFSPINPSDLGWINGVYGKPATKKAVKFPIIPGFEGSGVVVESYSKKFQVNDTVFYYTEKGAWADYVISNENTCFKFGENAGTSTEDFLTHSTYFINPLTALCFIQLAEAKYYKRPHFAVVNTAANSNLGVMFTKLCKLKHIKLINVLKTKKGNEQNSEDTHYIDLSHPEYLMDLKKVCVDWNCQIGFDCIGGEFSGRLLSTMCSGAELYHYGSMSMRNLGGFAIEDLLFENKALKGFWLLYHIKDKHKELKNDMITALKLDKSVFDSKLNKIFSLEEHDEAIKTYKENMSQGKCIFKF